VPWGLDGACEERGLAWSATGRSTAGPGSDFFGMPSWRCGALRAAIITVAWFSVGAVTPGQLS
jgi:hypothetical protein